MLLFTSRALGQVAQGIKVKAQVLDFVVAAAVTRVDGVYQCEFK